MVPPTEEAAFLTNFGSHTVTRINLATMAVDAMPIQVGRSPWGISLLPGGSRAAVANFYSGDLSILNLATSTEEKRIPLGADPLTNRPRRAKNVDATAASAARPAIVVVSDLSANLVMVIDPQAGTVLRSIEVGKAPYGLSFVPVH